MKSHALPLIALLLAACAQVDDAGMQLLASSATAVALVDQTLLHGQMTLMPDRSGRVELTSGEATPLHCAGTLHYTASQTGTVRLRCTDGTEASLVFAALDGTSGYGSGPSARGPVSLTYGMSAAQSAAYLLPPPDKRLIAGPLGLELKAR